jgi:hypothetical protein
MDLALLIALAGIGLMVVGVILIFVTSPTGLAVVALGTGTSISSLALRAPVAEVRLFRWVHVAKGQPLTTKRAPQGTPPPKSGGDTSLAA